MNEEQVNIVSVQIWQYLDKGVPCGGIMTVTDSDDRQIKLHFDREQIRAFCNAVLSHPDGRFTLTRDAVTIETKDTETKHRFGY